MEITPSHLGESDGWRDLYLEQGQEMLDLAEKLLGGTEEEQDLGLKIVEEAWFEEDGENSDYESTLSKASFKNVARSLEKLLSNKKFTLRAAFGILVAVRENITIQPDNKVFATLLEDSLKEKSKEKVRELNMQSIAFRVLVHGYGRTDELDKIVEFTKKRKGLKDELLEELEFWNARKYDTSALTEMAFKEVKAKGESRVLGAVELLNGLVKSGVDISEIIPYLQENQKRLSGFTDVVQVLGSYYLRTKKYEELEAWLNDEDINIAAGAYRGICLGSLRVTDASEFLARPEIVSRMDFLMSEKRLPGMEEYRKIVWVEG